MPGTGILGSTFASLGDLILGGSVTPGDVARGTAGLVALYPCDDLPASGVARGLTAAQDAAVTLGSSGTNFTQDEGIDGFAIVTPIAPPTGSPHTYDTTRHLSFATTGGPIGVGDAGTIEVWFKPLEFADEVAVEGGGSDASRDYRILELKNASGLVRFTTGQAGNGERLLRVAYGPAGWDGTEGGLVYGAFATSTGNAGYAGSTPPLEAGRWYYLAFAWDQTGSAVYCNGQKVASSTGTNANPGPGLNGADLTFGQSGGAYDLLAITNRRMTDGEILYRFDPGGASAPATSAVNATSVFANVAASYPGNARVTAVRAETLRTGTRNARVTATRAEVLRLVAQRSVSEPQLTQYLTFSETASGYTGSGRVDSGGASQMLAFTETAAIHRPVTHAATVTQTLAFTQSAYRVVLAAASQTLAFTQAATPRVIHPARQTLGFTETVGLAMVRDRRVLQLLALQQSETVGGTHNATLAEPLAFSETAVLGREFVKGALQLLAFRETVAGLDTHTYTAAPTDTLAFTQTATIARGKERSADETLALTDSVRLGKIWYRAAGDALRFRETAAKNPSVIARSAGDRLDLLEGGPVRLPILVGGVPVIVTRPPAQVVKVRRSVTLVSRKGAIALPVAELGDTDATNDVVTVKRTMTGIFYTYVKTTKTRTLNYEFVLDRAKALELRAFVLASQSELITLTNWKGEVYAGNLLSNPVTLTTAGRYRGAREKVTVTLQFEGVRLN
jgi:hypothetical protein